MKKAIDHRIILIIIFALTLSRSAVGQIGETTYFYKAEKLYQSGKYFEAAQVFEKYLASEKQNRSAGSPFAVETKKKNMPDLNMHEAAIYSLGDCYRNYHDFIRAEKYFKLATTFSNQAYSLAWYWYGETLRANKKYPEAYQAMSKFIETYQKMGPVVIKADQELADLTFIRAQLQRTDSNYTIRQQPVKDSMSVYAVSVLQNKTIAFTSVRTDNTPMKNNIGPDYNIRLYTGRLNDAILDLDHPLDIPDSAGVETGLASFTADGRTVFVTRWTTGSLKKHAAIYRSSLTDTGWTKPVRMESLVNLGDYNSTQPFVTEDGKFLFFASDRIGGMGGYDLYYAELDSAYHAYSAINLGLQINTPGDEQTPYYHSKSHTLFYSSNGRPGMGGFDIFYSRRGFDFQDWGESKNPGIPLNSVKDDQYFVSGDKVNPWNEAWISSDRSSECCLAVYKVQQINSLVVTGFVFDSATHQPLGNAQVTLSDPEHTNIVLGIEHTDSLGRYEWKSNNTSAFRIDAQKNGYFPDSIAGLEVSLEPGPNNYRTPDLYLAKWPTPKEKAKRQLAILNSSTNLANFAFNKHDLVGKASSNLDSLSVLLLQISDMVVEIGGYTDGKGTVDYNLRLAKNRVDACIAYLLKKGVPRAQLREKAYGSCCPIEPETIDGKDNPEGRSRNRRVEYKLVE
jgi:OmpA-OmpF porin, OOP family